MSENERDQKAGWVPRISNDMIRPFTGDGDIVAWLKKVKLVARLSKIVDLAAFIPLYLEGDALAVYLEMSEDDQNKAMELERKLKEAFSDGQFIAYGKLVNMKWTGEPVDVYANEIRRLAGLSGLKGEGLETIVKLNFVHGFPENISIELHQIENIEKLLVSDILSRARILVGNREGSHAAAVASNRTNRVQRKTGFGNEAKIEHAIDDMKMQSSHERASARGFRNGSEFRGKCFNCEGPHMARNCPEKRNIKCYQCGEAGHISTQCSQGN